MSVSKTRQYAPDDTANFKETSNGALHDGTQIKLVHKIWSSKEASNDPIVIACIILAKGHVGDSANCIPIKMKPMPLDAVTPAMRPIPRRPGYTIFRILRWVCLKSISKRLFRLDRFEGGSNCFCVSAVQ